jgi:NAD dependent epimerase/dehydratase family enzyme
MDQAVSGALNGSAPNPVTNASFTTALAKAVHRPAFLTVPAIALEALYGEMAGMLLAGQRAVPEAAQKLGFSWKYPGLGEALRNLLDY